MQKSFLVNLYNVECNNISKAVLSKKKMEEMVATVKQHCYRDLLLDYYSLTKSEQNNLELYKPIK